MKFSEHLKPATKCSFIIIYNWVNCAAQCSQRSNTYHGSLPHCPSKALLRRSLKQLIISACGCHILSTHHKALQQPDTLTFACKQAPCSFKPPGALCHLANYITVCVLYDDCRAVLMFIHRHFNNWRKCQFQNKLN